MSTSSIDVVRGEVRKLLESAPAYSELDAVARRDLARDLVRVSSMLTDRPDWLDLKAPTPEVQRSVDDIKSRVATSMADPQAPPQGTGGNFRAGAGAAATDSFRSLVGSVDFSEFVANLIKGVFKAIVDASIQQMQAYRDLVGAVVQSVGQFAKDISDDDANSFTMGQFPGMFSMNMGQMQLLPGQQVTDDQLKQMGMPAGTSLMNPQSMQVLQQQAKLQLGAQRQQMLATMVMMGINRIVVTDGKINARVMFDITAKDTAEATASTNYQADSSHTEVRKHSGGNIWGTSSDSSTTTDTSSVSVRSATTAKSDSEMNLNAQLAGEVTVNFKSETFPLEKLAVPGDIQKIQSNAAPAARS